MEDFRRLVARLSRPAARLRGNDGSVGAVNAAFLVALGGHEGPDAESARRLLDAPPAGPAAALAQLYLDAAPVIEREIAAAAAADPDFRLLMAQAVAALDGGDGGAAAEASWRVFFPEGAGILGHEDARVAELRRSRTIRLETLNPHPIAEPTTELLLTSNVLLTVPAEGTDLDELPYDGEFRRAVRAAAQEEQLFWYDHPIQIGVAPAANELLYGLRALDEAVEFERQRDPGLGRVRVVLSASVTHAGLRAIARDYVGHELDREGRLRNLVVHLFSDEDTLALADQVLAPLAVELGADAGALVDVFGVDGEYGRHYNFLKAIAALWQVVVDPRLRATFKIDLDQVFPQHELVAETGASALEHLRSPLWGARGRDSRGEPVELGMIAGALVNERDIGRGLFTPDVTFPSGPTTADEHVFFSRLPQALSTRAEMMERYDGPERDGRRACLERIHVTGGTNGILVEALRRHRPFTPSFIGRAEDQAYVLSVLGGGKGPRLAYAHQPGLIMRHDKESFAGAAIEAARVGKLVGDDVRILYFSAYADLLGQAQVKSLIDPFSGSFVSRLPVTVVMLRLALRIDGAFAAGHAALGDDLAEVGARRLGPALEFTADRTGFAAAIARERLAWSTYYDALDRLAEGIAGGRPEALELRRRSIGIVERTLLE
ncbi:hypothetical protein BH23CHL7_BH23CHL7_17730 [soil metagenome]